MGRLESAFTDAARASSLVSATRRILGATVEKQFDLAAIVFRVLLLGGFLILRDL
jgi:hypothetical protein